MKNPLKWLDIIWKGKLVSINAKGKIKGEFKLMPRIRISLVQSPKKQ